MIVIDICLSDLPKEKIKTSQKNGKKYIALIVSKRRDVGQYGETHTVAISKPREERDEKTIYVGSGKEYMPKSEQTTTAAPQTSNPDPFTDPDDGLPF
jgi:hypothetical protein